MKEESRITYFLDFFYASRSVNTLREELQQILTGVVFQKNSKELIK